MNFWTSEKLALNGPPNGPAVESKIKNRLSRALYNIHMNKLLMQYINNKSPLILCKSVKKWFPIFDKA